MAEIFDTEVWTTAGDPSVPQALARKQYVDTAIATEVTNRNAAIAASTGIVVEAYQAQITSTSTTNLLTYAVPAGAGNGTSVNVTVKVGYESIGAATTVAIAALVIDPESGTTKSLQLLGSSSVAADGLLHSVTGFLSASVAHTIYLQVTASVANQLWAAGEISYH